MSTILLQIGQCGNQIGYNIFSNLINEIQRTSEAMSQRISDEYFSINSKDEIFANALMIDMEAKVIEKCMRSANLNSWHYHKESIIKKQSGSGNNWANGFFNHGSTVEKDVIEAISALSEKFDYVDSFVLINSLAGGTGSGLGSYINLVVKDYFPTVNLLNISVWPHRSGEVVVNSYNTVFSISESYKASDFILIVNNQEIFNIAKDTYKLKKIGFEDLNSIISKQLTNVLVPTLGDSRKLHIQPISTRSKVGDIVSYMGEDPRFKLGRVISTPEVPVEQLAFTYDNWNSIFKRGHQILMSNSSSENKLDWNMINTCRLKRCHITCRGKGLEEIDQLIPLIFNKQIGNIRTYKDISHINGYEKHLSILDNSNFLTNNLNSTLKKCKEMFEFNAFLHQYEKYGMEKNDFIDAFVFCEQINFDYNN